MCDSTWSRTQHLRAEAVFVTRWHATGGLRLFDSSTTEHRGLFSPLGKSTNVAAVTSRPLRRLRHPCGPPLLHWPAKEGIRLTSLIWGVFWGRSRVRLEQELIVKVESFLRHSGAYSDTGQHDCSALVRCENQRALPVTYGAPRDLESKRPFVRPPPSVAYKISVSLRCAGNHRAGTQDRIDEAARLRGGHA